MGITWHYKNHIKMFKILALGSQAMVPFGKPERTRERFMRMRYEIALFLIGMGLTYLASRIVQTVYLNRGLKTNLCPNCGSIYVKRSSRRRLTDLPFRLFRLLPYRCTLCQVRFFAFLPPIENDVRASHDQAAEARQ
jgi:hypothetical protein